MVEEEYDELDRFIDIQINNELSKLIVNDIGLFTCQLFKSKNKKDPIPFASGVLAEFGNECYILTASHVIEDWGNDNHLFVQILDGYVSVTGKGTGTDIEEKKIDVAYIKLDALIALALKRGGYKFLTINRIRGHVRMLESGQYCVFGYPTIQHRIEDGVLKTKGAAYFVKAASDKVYKYYGFDRRSNHVMQFIRKAVNIKSGIEEKIKTEHYGLSGCGLWLTTLQHNADKFISDAKLIGIMTEFRSGKYDCLIGNRIELLLVSLQNIEGLKFKGKVAGT